MPRPDPVPAFPSARGLLLQLRDPGDVMGPHEATAFRRALSPLPVELASFDLLSRPLTEADLAGIDLVFMGGSGAYSATSAEPWLDVALDSLRRVHASGIPAFASCWGFQGMAAAMGGSVVRDRERAEIGTFNLRLTAAGRSDPLFGSLGSPFRAQLGHEDVVVALPAAATLLASSEKVVNQAYRFDDAPIYCTQFHPELRADDLRERLLAYPKYLVEVAREPLDQLLARLRESPEAGELLRRFARMHLGPGLAPRRM